MADTGGKQSLRKCYGSSKAVVGMLLVQLFATGLQLLSRIVLNEGMFVFALMSYRHIVAALCVSPFALILERGNSIKLTPSIWFWLSTNALTGIIGAMGLYYYGLRDTTATYAVNFLNLIPIVTFILSVTLRMEALRLRTWAGRMKSIGTLLCVGGALTTSLYTGKLFYINHHVHLGDKHVVHQETNKARGSIMLSCSCLCYALWFLVQGKLLKMFPLKYWATLLTCIIASAQSIVIGLCIDRSRSAWKLKFDLKLLTIVYSGALATAATFCLVSWAVANRGPTYPPMFNPLTLIFVSVLEALILGDPIKLGTMLGTVLIIAGLYSYLWGKTNESKTEPQENHQPSSTVEAIVVEVVPASSTVTVTTIDNLDREATNQRS